ncbi:MAG: F0F1 ATP synthase subunit A, partial [Proteobacteria bacterium]
MAMFATVVVILLSVAGRLALGSGEAAIEPAGHMSIKGFFEAFTEFITGITHQVLGHYNDFLIPMFGSMFFYIIFNNLLGLIPGFSAATSDINTALSIGLFSFVAYNAIGVHHAGLAYFKHYLGPVWWMIPILLPIEIISNFIRPLSLGIRLHVNMMADHTILGTFVDLTKVI